MGVAYGISYEGYSESNLQWAVKTNWEKKIYYV
jgi:hypothetical protein